MSGKASGKKRKAVSFTDKTYDPEISKSSTTNHGYLGVIPKKVPSGSQREDGRFTGSFRGLNVVNPWGGGRKYTKSNKSKSKSKSKKNYKRK
jgi:hypothetical protein